MVKPRFFVSICVVLLAAAIFAGCAASTAGTDKSEGAVGIDVPEIKRNETIGSAPEVIPEPTKDEEAARARQILEQLSLKEKVGQLILAYCPENTAAQIAAQYALGGYVMFESDFEEKNIEEVQDYISAIGESAKLPMLIAVDEEGGSVVRVSSNPQLRESRFMSPKELYDTGGWDSIAYDTKEKCALLSLLGINVNLAPVCDLASEDSFMYNRTFSSDAEETSRYVRTVVETMNENSFGSTLKHFPGYGDNVDTHTGSALDERSYEEFQSNDFLPFKAGIEVGAGSVMVNHNIIACMDAEYPASLSPEVHRVLREELGFQGVIMTDGLDMGAITDFAESSGLSTYVLAIQAGNDMLCCDDYAAVSSQIITAVTSGVLTEDRIDESVLRVLLWKIDLGIIETESQNE